MVRREEINTKKTQENWEREFDEQFESWNLHHRGLACFDDALAKFTLKSFIHALLTEQKKVTEKNISMLRQWLNEERITDPKKMVTNEELKAWLNI